MISEQMKSARMELNATNEGLIPVKVNLAPLSTYQTNSSNHIFNISMTWLPPYHGTSSPDAISSVTLTLP